jgi:hypothetical protein
MVREFREMGAVHIKVDDVELVFLPPTTEAVDQFVESTSSEETLKSWIRMPPTPDALRPREIK